MLDCYFCKKLASPPPDELVWEFPQSLVLLGPWQFFHGYCLVVSKVHATELSQLAHQCAEFLEEMATLAEAIEVCFRPHKLNYELLGNQVAHLHWHLFPRSLSDPDRLRPVWFALDAAEQDESIREKLRTGPIPRSETIQTLRHSLTKRSST